ncbi:MAG: hypothetical protein ACOCQ4_00425 [bacterium]
MITQKEIIKASQYHNVPKSTVDKDRVLGHLLNALFSFDDSKREINRRAWNSSLQHQIPTSKLPDFDEVYDQMGGFTKKLMNDYPE